MMRYRNLEGVHREAGGEAHYLVTQDELHWFLLNDDTFRHQFRRPLHVPITISPARGASLARGSLKRPRSDSCLLSIRKRSVRFFIEAAVNPWNAAFLVSRLM